MTENLAPATETPDFVELETEQCVYCSSTLSIEWAPYGTCRPCSDAELSVF